MKLVRVAHLHGAVALDGARTPIHVVAHGTGRLTVGDVRVWIRGGVDRVFLVTAQDLVRVRARGLLGSDETLLRIVTLPPPTEPPPPVLVAPTRAAIPSVHAAPPDVAPRPLAPAIDLDAHRAGAQR